MMKPGAFGDPLTDRERRCAELSALGWTDARIGRQLGTARKPVASSTVSRDLLRAITKTGVGGRIALALWAIDNVLDSPTRADWAMRAGWRRRQLRAAKVLNDQRVALLMLLTDPKHCDKSNEELGLLCIPIMGSPDVNDAMIAATTNIGPHGSKTKLAVVLRLAPLVVQRQDVVANALVETL